jgi:protease II
MGDVRDLGFVVWNDEFGALEDMTGTPFKRACASENIQYKNTISEINEKTKQEWLDIYDSINANETIYHSFSWNKYEISVGGRKLHIEISGKGKHVKMPDLMAYGTTKNLLWVIKDSTEGGENLDLIIYNKNLDIIAKIKEVGDTAKSNDNLIYFVKAQDTFWFNEVHVIDEQLNQHMIYREPKKNYLVEISKPKNQDDCIYFIRKSAIYQDLALINNNGITWLAKGYGRKKLVNKHTIALDSYFKINDENVSYPKGWYLSNCFSNSGKYYFTLTKDNQEGAFIYNDAKWTTLIEPFIGDITLIGDSDYIIKGYPNKPDEIYTLKDDTLVLDKKIDGQEFKIHGGLNPVPWFMVSKSNSVKGVIIIGYGSYGINMRKHQIKIWEAWALRGYAVVSVCVRGGCENGDKWWDEGRTSARKQNSVNDFVATVNYIQTKYGFNRSNTVIFGRSAGVYLVTSASYKLMDKVGVVYAAKPYTDMLRTVTSKKELQAVIETDEFGYALTDPVQFYEVLNISPYENVPKNPSIQPAYLLTTGTNDPEVPSYMPVKYAKRLRMNNFKNVICRIQNNEGHFTSKTAESAEALDGAICESFLDNVSKHVAIG